MQLCGTCLSSLENTERERQLISFLSVLFTIIRVCSLGNPTHFTKTLDKLKVDISFYDLSKQAGISEEATNDTPRSEKRRKRRLSRNRRGQQIERKSEDEEKLSVEESEKKSSTDDDKDESRRMRKRISGRSQDPSPNEPSTSIPRRNSMDDSKKRGVYRKPSPKYTRRINPNTPATIIEGNSEPDLVDKGAVAVSEDCDKAPEYSSPSIPKLQVLSRPSRTSPSISPRLHQSEKSPNLSPRRQLSSPTTLMPRAKSTGSLKSTIELPGLESSSAPPSPQSNAKTLTPAVISVVSTVFDMSSAAQSSPCSGEREQRIAEAMNYLKLLSKDELRDVIVEAKKLYFSLEGPEPVGSSISPHTSATFRKSTSTPDISSKIYNSMSTSAPIMRHRSATSSADVSPTNGRIEADDELYVMVANDINLYQGTRTASRRGHPEHNDGCHLRGHW